jgi:hypothetical protein
MATNQNVPGFVYVSGITNEQYPTVTFTAAHNFVLSEIISFRVSRPYGMVEINNERAKVLAVGSNTVVIDIDTSYFTPFIYPVTTAQAPPVAVPVGSGVQFDYSPYFILNDAFDNIEVFT